MYCNSRKANRSYKNKKEKTHGKPTRRRPHRKKRNSRPPRMHRSNTQLGTPQRNSTPLSKNHGKTSLQKTRSPRLDRSTVHKRKERTVRANLEELARYLCTPEKASKLNRRSDEALILALQEHSKGLIEKITKSDNGYIRLAYAAGILAGYQYYVDKDDMYRKARVKDFIRILPPPGEIPNPHREEGWGQPQEAMKAWSKNQTQQKSTK